MAGSSYEIGAALSNALAAIPGLRVADHLPEQVAPPMAIVQLQQVIYHRAMQGGVSEWTYLVAMIAGRMGDRAAQRQLDAWVSYDGAASVRGALEDDPTLGGIAQSLMVSDMVAVRPITLGDANYLSVELNLTVYA